MALVLALGMGGAYAAGKVGPGEIAKNAVKSKHLTNSGVKTRDLAAGAVTAEKLADGVEGIEGPRGPAGATGDPGRRGPAGPKGDAGPQGSAGPKGDPGPSGLSGYQVLISPGQSVSPGNGTDLAAVNCPGGKKVLGGGVSSTNFSVARIALSAPLNDGLGWVGAAYNDGSNPITAYVWAICAHVSS
jgi:hypothetical protein